MADALTRRLGDLPTGWDERINDMEQVVLKAQNLPEQRRILVNGLPMQDHDLISVFCPGISG